MKNILILSLLLTTILSARMKAKLKSNDSIITMNDTTNDTDTDTTPIKDDDDDTLVYCNNMSFFTNNIQIAVTHQGIAFFIKDGLLNIFAKDIQTLRLF